MFPLQLLSLLFISNPGLEPPAERKKKKADSRRAETSKYDMMFSRGDLLEVPRTLFIHFGIYLGGGR